MKQTFIFSCLCRLDIFFLLRSVNVWYTALQGAVPVKGCGGYQSGFGINLSLSHRSAFSGRENKGPGL